MIDAKTARENSKRNRLVDQLKVYEKLIWEAIEKGVQYVELGKEIEISVLDRLKELGYWVWEDNQQIGHGPKWILTWVEKIEVSPLSIKINEDGLSNKLVHIVHSEVIKNVPFGLEKKDGFLFVCADWDTKTLFVGIEPESQLLVYGAEGYVEVDEDYIKEDATMETNKIILRLKTI